GCSAPISGSPGTEAHFPLQGPPRLFPRPFHVGNCRCRRHLRGRLDLETDHRPTARPQIADVEQDAQKITQFWDVVVAPEYSEQRVRIAVERVVAVRDAVADVNVDEVLADEREMPGRLLMAQVNMAQVVEQPEIPEFAAHGPGDAGGGSAGADQGFLIHVVVEDL